MSNPYDNMQYIIPTLEEDGQLAYNPDVFMNEYGVYLDEYDQSNELIATAEHNILQADTLLSGYDELQKANKKMGKLGFATTQSDTLQSSMLDTIGTDLQLKEMKKLSDISKYRRKHRKGIYDMLGYVASAGGYDEEYSPGMQEMSPGEASAWLSEYQSGDINVDQDFGSPCPCPDGGFSVSCCTAEEEESSAFENMWISDGGDMDMGDLGFGWDWGNYQENSGSAASDFWSSGAVTAYQNYDSCLEGAASVTEQEFCYTTLENEANQVQNITHGMIICDPEHSLYDEEACANWSMGE
tara:strand:- start:15104 stop:15997 length:894 start_codon:yes stop_codon:yes gene_type:complete